MGPTYNIGLVESFNKHLTLIKKIAYSIRRKVPENGLQIDDLIQAGVIGFLEAYKNYDETKGASFSTYANIRIHGSIMDEVRRVDWAPRSSYKVARLVAEARKEIEDKSGREATLKETASYMRLSLEELGKLLCAINSYRVAIVEDVAAIDGFIDNSSDREEMFNNLQKDHFFSELDHNIGLLPEIEKNIINWYYNEDINQREIGVRLGVSESRICQIRQKAIDDLRSKMQKWL